MDLDLIRSVRPPVYTSTHQTSAQGPRELTEVAPRTKRTRQSTKGPARRSRSKHPSSNSEVSQSRIIRTKSELLEQAGVYYKRRDEYTDNPRMEEKENLIYRWARADIRINRCMRSISPGRRYLAAWNRLYSICRIRT